MYARIYEWLEKYNGHQVGCREKRKDAERNDIIGGGVRHWGG